MKAKMPIEWQTSWRDHGIRWVLTILLLILATTCSARERTCPTGEPLPERWPVCSDEDRLAAMGMADFAPDVSIPNSPGCIMQLLVHPDKNAYECCEYITIIAMLRIHGGCTLRIAKTQYPLIDFAPTVTSETGDDIPLTEEAQRLKERQERALLDGRIMWYDLTEDHNTCIRLPIDEWFDLSASGTYTLTLVRSNAANELHQIPGNTVTFTRLP